MPTPSNLTLSSLQHTFLDAIINDGNDGTDNAAALDAIIAENGISASRRLQIYKNNTFITLSEALAANYPVVAKLVGDDFFAYLAHHYIRAFPPPSGTLIDFGTDLGAFLADFEAARELVYLPDVARLESAWQKAYHSPDATPLSADDLAGIAPDRYGDVIFTLHPSAQIVCSRYPVARIWAANQSCPEDSRKNDNGATLDRDDEDEETIDLDDGGENVLLIRPDAAVHVIALPAADIAFLKALDRGARLARAIETAQQSVRRAGAPEDFNPTVSLGRLIALGALNRWTVA